MNNTSKLMSGVAAKPHEKNIRAKKSLAQEHAAEDQRYVPVQREWIQRSNHQSKPAPRSTEESQESGASIMMQRWYHETMQQQPFNNFGAIGKPQYDAINHESRGRSNVDGF